VSDKPDSLSYSHGLSMPTRYLEILESSCFNVVADYSGVPAAEVCARAIAIAKLHALFGGSLTLDGVSLLASQVLMSLFADAAFRTFLAANPDYIRLVSVYRDSDRRRDRLAIATSGFARAMDPDWLSTTFPSRTQ